MFTIPEPHSLSNALLSLIVSDIQRSEGHACEAQTLKEFRKPHPEFLPAMITTEILMTIQRSVQKTNQCHHRAGKSKSATSYSKPVKCTARKAVITAVLYPKSVKSNA